MIEHDYSGISWQLGTPRECINSSGFFFFFPLLRMNLLKFNCLSLTTFISFHYLQNSCFLWVYRILSFIKFEIIS